MWNDVFLLFLAAQRRLKNNHRKVTAVLVEHALEYAAREAEAERLKTKSKIKAQTEGNGNKRKRYTFEMTKQSRV